MSTTYELTDELFNDWFFDVYKDHNRYLHLYGGAGSGKSVVAVQKILLRFFFEKTKHRFLIVRKTGRTIRESVFQLFKEIIIQWDMYDEFTFNKSELSITYIHTGSQVITTGMDDPEKLKSIAGLTGVWIEEGTELEADDFNEIDRRLRGHTDYYKQIIISYNPTNENHWIVKRFFDQETESTNLYKTTYLNNRFIDPDYKQMLNDLVKFDDNAYRVYCLGEWGVVNVENPFMHNYDSIKHEAPVVYDPNKHLNVIIDFNIYPMAVNFAHIWVDQNGHHCHVFDEWDIKNASIEEFCRRLLTSRYDDKIQSLTLTGDRMGANRTDTSIDNASRYELIRRTLGLSKSQLVVPPNPTHGKSRNDCNYVLAMYDDFKINPNTCPNTVRDMKIVSCDAFGSIIKRDRKKIEEQADHLDNVRYMINTFLSKWVIDHQKARGTHRIISKMSTLR